MKRPIGTHYKVRGRAAWRAVAAAGIVAGTLFAVSASSSPAHAATPLLDLGGTIQYNGNGAVGWSDSGTPAATSPCANGGVHIAGTHGLFDCGALVGTEATPFPVTNQAPTFNSTLATANGAYQGAFIIDQLNDSYTDCGAGAPTQGSNLFGGGNKFDFDPSADSYSLGHATPKDEISNAYAVAGQSADGSRQVYLGMERTDPEGNTHADFQFLHETVLQPTPCSGDFTGPGGGPSVHQQGDIAVQIDYGKGGSDPTIALLVWSCDGSLTTTPVGTECSHSKKAGWVAEQACGVGQTAGCYQPGAIAMATNADNEVPCGAWVCRKDHNSEVTEVGKVAANNLMEASVNLDGLGFDFGCSATFWPVTRAAAGNTEEETVSPAANSQLKSFAPPAGFQTCPSTTTTTSVSAARASFGTGVTDSATVTRQAGTTGTPAGSVAFFACGPFETQPTTNPACTPDADNATSVGTVTEPASTTDTTATFTSPSFQPDDPGWYCFDAEYTPSADAHLLGSTDQGTQVATECYQYLTPPSITAQKSESPSDPAVVAPGGTVDYTITVANSGQSDATGVSVSDALPAYTTFVSADNGGTSANGKVTWSNLTIPGGGTKTLTLQVQVGADAPQQQDIANTAQVTSDFGQCDGQTCPTNTVHETVLFPVVEAAKSQTPPTGSTVHRGDQITYTVTVADYGLADALNVPVTDTVPTGTTFVSATNGGTESNGKVTWLLADLAAGTMAEGATTVTPGAAQTVSFTVTVDSADTNGQVITNVAGYGNVHNPDPGCATAATCPTNQVTATVQVVQTAAQQVTTTSTTSTTVAPTGSKPAATTRSGLAFTGADVIKTIGGGLVLGVGGGLLVLASRRRSRRES